MEIWDLYDKNRNKTAKRIVKGRTLPTDCFLLVVCAGIFNHKNELLIRQRNTTELKYPNHWDISVRSSVLSGEDNRSAVERAVKTKLDYPLNLANQRPALTLNFGQGFQDIFLLDMNLDLSQLDLARAESQQVKWASEEEVLKLIKEESFVPHYQKLLPLFFSIKKNVFPDSVENRVLQFI